MHKHNHLARRTTRRQSAHGSSGGLARLGLAVVLAATPLHASLADGVADPAHHSSLDAAGAREWQNLLAVQATQRAVHITDLHMPIQINSAFERLVAWNEVALDTTAIDHTPPGPTDTYTFGQQFGPHRSSRAMAIVHIAMFEAVNAVSPKYRSYVGLARAHGKVSVDAAIAQSAHDALVYLYPSQQPRLDALLASDLAAITTTPAALAAGKALGAAAAQAIVALRRNDGSDYVEPSVGTGPGQFTPIGGPGHWSPDPVSQATTALGAYWGKVKPFVIESANQFLPPPPPSISSWVFAEAYQDVKALGGDPSNGTPTIRTPGETQQGIFWTYDGTPNICAPPRLYNQLARTIMLQRGLTSVVDAARYLALVNTAMADAGITAWNAKWHYQFWRPVTAIRDQESYGNPEIVADPTWYPLGAQATNTHGPNFTPPFPAYPSGHATFGGAVFETMRAFFPDNTKFTFVSDEFNGRNTNASGQLMPYEPVTFNSLSDAEYANAESRIWIGVHWQFDADAGDKAGRAVARFVFSHAFRPLSRESN